MLKLKRVEIHGFKSFYDRTEMRFNGNGIAAVVGPNGCGKSNLSDAISWVLGEQSAKSLRGARMEDVIFAGTRDRKALGMASVTMTLVPDAAKLRLLDQARQAAEAEAAERAAAEKPPAEPASEVSATDEAAAGPVEPTEPTQPTEAAVAPISVRSAIEQAASQTGEITITRRLYRSGESEYLINGKTSRLRDIQDLFLGTGLGPESYAIIEQGRIGQILSNKPQDRRAVIEEAAGITKFKTRKRLAEAKLESAKQNLARVFDILEEVTRQANSLKRQAAKTKRYGELKTEAADYLRRLLATRFRRLERETARVVIELNLASTEWQNAQTAIQEREGEQTSVLESSYANEQELTGARKLLSDFQVEAERALGKLDYQKKQINQIEQRLNAGDRELQSIDHQQQERSRELEQQTEEWRALDAGHQEKLAGLEAKSNERQQAQSRLAAQERALEEARQRVLKMLGESAALRNRITQVDAQLAASDRDVARLQEDERSTAAEQERLQQLRSDFTERLSAGQTDLQTVAEERRQVDAALQAERAKLNENRQAFDRLRTDHSRIKARKDSLAEIILHRSYTTDTVKRLFTAIEKDTAGGFKAAGVLADFVEVDPGFEKAAEEFLHDDLESVVVRTMDEAEQGVELLRGSLNGRGTFIAEQAEEPSQIAPLPQPEGSLTRLSSVLHFTNGLTALPPHLLPRIANAYFVEDRPAARRLSAEYPHCWFLTPDGVSYHGRSVSGGKKSAVGPLALKRELREVSLLELEKQTEMTAAQEEIVRLEASLASLTEQLERLRASQQTQEKNVLALDHELRKLAEESQRAASRLARARGDLERLAKDRLTLEENRRRDGLSLEQADQNRAMQETNLQSSREQLTAGQAELSRIAEEHSAARAELASLEERRRSLANSRARLETQVRDFANRRASLFHENERLTAESGQFLKSNQDLEVKIAELREVQAATQGDVDRLAAREAALRARLAASEEELKNLRASAQALQEKRTELQVALARGESELKHLEETCQKELDTPLTELAEAIEIIESDADLLAIDTKHTEVRRKIEALGPVNPTALEEFEEASQRQEFLTAQRQDLIDSIRDIEKAIHEIDGESRKRFGEAFHAINANFKVMFQVLFGGGVGEMRLTDEDNLADSGIDIVASPPGKKLQSVLLLSGGEKSLTAMALLMGIFQYTPSPFCILDEVDAPLDEPNIERLTRLLKEMADQTQFIVITHAKRTMEAAQALYGVTMQEPGVSKLVSVKFKPSPNAPPPFPEKKAQLPVPEQEAEAEATLAGAAV